MNIMLMSETSEYDHLFRFSDESILVKKAKSLSEAKFLMKKFSFNVVFIIVTDSSKLDEFTKFVKETREKNIWVPVCFITTLPVVYDDLIARTNGYNCITLIDLKQSKDDVTKQIEDVLFLTSEKGQTVLQRLTELLSDVHNKIDNLSSNLSQVLYHS